MLFTFNCILELNMTDKDYEIMFQQKKRAKHSKYIALFSTCLTKTLHFK